jgi:iron(III) transport system permease protein
MGLNPRHLLLSFAVFGLVLVSAPVAVLLYNSIFSAISNPESISGFLSSPRQMRLLTNSIKVACAVTFFSAVIGVPTAFILKKTDIPLKKFFILCLVAALIVPQYIMAIAWVNLLGSRGIITEALNVFGFEAPPYTIYGFWGVVFVLTLSLFPIVVFFTGSSMDSIDSRLEDAALVSKGMKSAVSQVILPLSIQGILFGSMLVFILSLSDFGVSSFLMYPNYSVEIYSRLVSFYDVPSATFYSLSFMIITFPLLILYSTLISGGVYTSIFSCAKTASFRLGKLKLPLFALILGVCLMPSALPLSSIFYSSLFLYGEFTPIENYMWALKQAKDSILNTIAYSFYASISSTFLGLSWAYLVHKRGKLTSFLAELPFMVTFILPGSLLGLSLIYFWNTNYPAVYVSSAVIILGYVARYGIIGYKSASIGLSKVDSPLFDAAKLAPVNWIKKIHKIILPIIWGPLAAGFCITFLLCARELDTVLTVYPPGSDTLPISIFILYHAGPPGLVATLSIILLIVATLPLILLSKIMPSILKWRGIH